MKENGIVAAYASCADMAENWDGFHYVAGHSRVRRLEQAISELLSLPVAVTNRGMTAIMTTILGLTKANDTIVCSEAVYPGTKMQLLELAEQCRIKVFWWNHTDQLGLHDLVKNKGLRPTLIFTETIGNAPSMPVADMNHLSNFAQLWDVPLVVDTTFTPLWTLGRSCPQLVIVGSMTKFHSSTDMAMGGYIAAEQEMLDRITATRLFNDSVMLPDMVSYFLGRGGGLRHMPWRYEGHCENAEDAARLMSDHDAVGEVWYPRLEGHHGNELLSQFGNWRAGAVFYAWIKGGLDTAVRLADGLAGQGDWELAVSFGSDKWRILPFVGELAQHTQVKGLVRISAGYCRGDDNEFSAPNLEILKSVLDTLVT